MAQQALGPGTAVPRRAGPVRAARRRRLGLGVGQGLRLADHHHLPARLPARPRLLLDGRPDGRPRRPGLVADQPLPADERDPAVPGAGRRAHPVGAVAAGAAPAAAAHRRSGIQVGTQILLHRRHRRDDRDRHGLRRHDRRDRQLRQVGRGPAAARAARRRQRRLSSPAASTSSAAPTRPAPRPTRSSSSAPIQRPARSANGRRADTLKLPEPSTPTAAADHARRTAARSAAATRPAPVDTTWKTLLNDQGGLGAVVERAAAPRARRPTPRRSSSATSCGCTAAATRTGRSEPSSAASSGSPRPRVCPENPDEGKLVRWAINNSANLPAARTNASGWGANGAIYLAGGNDGSGPQGRGLLGGPDDRRRHPRVEAPRRQRPARVGARGRAGRRQRTGGRSSSAARPPTAGPRVQHAGEHRAA